MKKVLILTLVIGGFTFTSCKKEISCDCANLTTLTTSVKTVKAKSGEEEAACQDEAETIIGIPVEICLPQ